jgi:hypothetical protein
MNTSPEQVQIVRTVISEFLPMIQSSACGEKVLGIVLKYVKGNANQATTRCEVHRLRLQRQKGFARPTPRPEPANRRED